MNIIIAVLTFVLILVAVFLVLVVLSQKAKNDGGMGAAMGGGMAEAAFGADTSNVLTKATINAAIVFFVLSFGLYLGHIHQRSQAGADGEALPEINAPATVPAPAATAPITTVPAEPIVPAPAPVEAPQP